MTTLLLDTHTLHWWSSEPAELSDQAASAIEEADELVIASISWFELAWLAENDRITITIPIRSWLEGMAGQVRTVPITPAVAAAAVALPKSFPGDPMDRIIYATATEHGWPLVTKDERMRRHTYPHQITLW